MDFREEVKNKSLNEVIMLELDDNEIVENIIPSQAISSASKGDVIKVSKERLNRIVKKFTEIVKHEYTKHAKKQRYIGRIRFITDTGKITEYPIKSLTKDSYDKIMNNKAKGKGRDTSSDENKNRLRVEVGNGEWRVINLDNVLGIIFKGKVYSLEDITRGDDTQGTQQSRIIKFAENQANQKTLITNKLIKVLEYYKFDKIPDVTTFDKEKRKALKAVRSANTITKYIKTKKESNEKSDYSIEVKGYNVKEDTLKIETKVNLQKILLTFGLEHLVLSKPPVGYDKKSWRVVVTDTKNEIIETMQRNGFDAKVGREWVSLDNK